MTGIDGHNLEVDEKWPVDTNDFSWHVFEANAYMNRFDSPQVIERLRGSIVEDDLTQTRYAYLQGGYYDQEISNKQAIVMFNPHANGLTDNMLVRGESIRLSADLAGLHDADGRRLPVFILPSPALGETTPPLSANGLRSLSSGDFGPLAKEMLEPVYRRNFGQLAIFGFSQGADLALDGAYQAAEHTDVMAVAAGEPVSVVDRKSKASSKLLMDFMRSGSQFKDQLEASDNSLQEAAIKPIALDFTKFFAGAALKGINWRLREGMSHNLIYEKLSRLIASKRVDTLVVGYGTESDVSRASELSDSLVGIRNEHGDDSVYVVQVDDADHTWGDNLNLLDEFYVRSLELASN